MIKFSSAESFNLLDQLNADQQPAWGKMTAQHMLEHLILTMKMSVGKIKIPLITKEEDLPKRKQFILSDQPMPRNYKGVIKTDDLLPLKFKTIEEAKGALKDAVAEFYEYYAVNNDTKELHPVFGPLDKSEWEFFHNKHFTHHFSQFDLVSDTK